MYQRLHTSAADYLGRQSPELDRYFLEYQREFHRFGVISTKKELVTSLLQSQIALCGDYHTLSQAQRTAQEYLAEILPTLKRQGRPVVLALEMLPFARTEEAARFLSGSLGEAAFLKAIGFRRSWGFDWKSYQPLFAFCGQNAIRLVGLNGPSVRGNSSLGVRDRFSAGVLANLSAADPRAFIFSLVGDLHLAPTHLPGELVRALDGKGVRRKVVTLHQNQEDFYWKLAERGLEDQAEVVRLRDGVYCLMNTPPWIKLQSLVQWSERQGGDGVEMDFTEEVSEVLELLQSFLGIEGPVDPDFRVCGPRDVKWLAGRRPRHGLSRAVLLDAIGRFEGHFVAGENLIFLADYGMHAIASQAAKLMHFQLSGFQGEFLNPRRDFFPFVWIEALAFLGSKLINPRQTPADSNLPSPRLPAYCRTARGVLNYYAHAKRVGSHLGNSLFRAVIRGKVERDAVRSLFENPFSDGKKAQRLYLEWTRRLTEGS